MLLFFIKMDQCVVFVFQFICSRLDNQPSLDASRVYDEITTLPSPKKIQPQSSEYGIVVCVLFVREFYRTQTIHKRTPVRLFTIA